MAEKVALDSHSLVKYNTPVLVTTHKGKKLAGRPYAAGEVGITHLVRDQAIPYRLGESAQASSANKEAEEILNAILPPKEWEENGQLWRQHVSSNPATRLDVINLQEQLDMKLQQQQARETGICPVRRELYTQCFGYTHKNPESGYYKILIKSFLVCSTKDELIRQVTINCAERGLLLLRVRDEIRMTIAAYQTLYESSVAFGMRKALMSEQGKHDLEQTVETLRHDKKELEKQVVEQKARAEQIERRANELRIAEEKKHLEELVFYKKTNQQLKAQLEGIIISKNK